MKISFIVLSSFLLNSALASEYAFNLILAQDKSTAYFQDQATGYIWSRTMPKQMRLSRAQAYCQSLPKVLGRRWTLPSLIEWQTAFDNGLNDVSEMFEAQLMESQGQKAYDKALAEGKTEKQAEEKRQEARARIASINNAGPFLATETFTDKDPMASISDYVRTFNLKTGGDHSTWQVDDESFIRCIAK